MSVFHKRSIPSDRLENHLPPPDAFGALICWKPLEVQGDAGILSYQDHARRPEELLT